MKVTQKQWEERLKKIQEESKKCKNKLQLMESTGYSRFIIESVFKHFPKQEDKIISNLSQNNKVKKNETDKEKSEKRIREILKASEECKTFREITKKTSYSYFIIKSTLEKFPEEAQRVMANLGKKLEKENDTIETIMIDTSICNVENIFETLQKYVQDGKKIGITDLVLNEMAALQSMKCNDSKAACRFLHIIKSNIEYFEYYKIKEKIRKRESNDQAIIESCFPIREKTILLTADKEMYIQAVFQGVNCIYMQKRGENEETQKLKFQINEIKENNTEIQPQQKINHKKSIRVLKNAYIENGKLLYKKINRKDQLIKVFSKSGIEKNEIKILLEEGDHIYICTKIDNYISFVDFEVYSVSKKLGKSIFVYNHYNYELLINVKNPKYKNFIQKAIDKFKVI